MNLGIEKEVALVFAARKFGQFLMVKMNILSCLA